MTCPQCGNDTILIYENGLRLDCCFYCGNKTERDYHEENDIVLPEVFEEVAEEKRDDLLP